MNKTVAVNIAGFIFNIEEEAYSILSDYLDSVRSKFSDENERDEIMRDIEARIAELFQNKINLSKEVIVLSDVQEIISIMGTPEEYTDEEEYQETSSAQSSKPKTRKKKLFRDAENGIISGVCSGLAAYMGIDVLLVRIAFVIFGFGGTGIIGYFILMLIVPEAKTASDKLKMKGEPINVENIKQVFHTSKDEFKRRSHKTKEKARIVANNGADAIRKIFKVFGRIFGFFLIAFAVVSSIVFFSLFLGESGVIHLNGAVANISFSEFINIIFPNELQGNMMTIGLALVMGIPVLGAMFVGTKLLLGIKGSIKGFSVAATCCWIIGGILCAVTGLQLALEFQDEGSVDYNIELANNTVDTLFLDVSHDQFFSDNISYGNGREFQLLTVDDENILFGYPTLEIRKSVSDTNFSVQLIKESRGSNFKQALTKAENLKYDIISTNDSLTFSPYFTTKTEDKWRAQTTSIIVWVPEGKTVHISKGMDRIMSHSDHIFQSHSDKMMDHFKTMTKESLNRISLEEERLYSIISESKSFIKSALRHP
ncbi:MAG: PspC domain-containing protein [Flavobacteriales bacterium]|nr:PspC domain-containing protein [Flavobacteriales bacterium]